MGDYYTSENASPARFNDMTQPPLQTAQGNVQPAQNVTFSPPQNNVALQNLNAAPYVSDPAYRYSTSTFSWDFAEILRRAVKYLIEGLAVAFVAYYFVGKGKLNVKDIVMLGITAAFVFAILDVFSPTVALGARFGAGFGIGTGLFGLNPAVIGGPAFVAPLI